MRLAPQWRKPRRAWRQLTSKSCFFHIANINGLGFIVHRGKPINVDLVSCPLNVSLLSFTLSVHANAVHCRFNHSLQLDVAFALHLPKGAASGQATNSSTVSTPPPLRNTRVSPLLTCHHESIETTSLGSRLN